MPIRFFANQPGLTLGTATLSLELYSWDGNPAGTLHRFSNVQFDPKFRVEGVTPGTIGGRPAIIFVDDRGGYQVLWGDDPRLKTALPLTPKAAVKKA